MQIEVNLVTKIGKKGDELWLLENTKQINFLIGPNNSGKSRKLREFFEVNSSDWVFDYSDISKLDVINKMQEIGSELQYYLPNFIDSIKFVRAVEDYPVRKPVSSLIKYLYDHSKTNINRSSDTEINQFWHQIEPHLINSFPQENLIEKVYSNPNHNWSRVYIPTLRSLRQVAKEDIFEQRTKRDYFSSKQIKDGEIFTGYSLYEDLTLHLLGSHDKRQKIREFEKYLSQNFFFGHDISLVPMAKEDVVYVKEGDDEDRPIYDLGDGIQSIIILTYKVFMSESPTMFFIEEPEHYLHAGLQRTLIETFSQHKEHMFFMTTHSNHFLDLAQERNDISIQQVSRKNGETGVESALELGEVITSLGVRASSVLLANCSIWVEGVTDKLYFRTYLEKFIDELEDESRANKLKSFHENLHYVFAEYQGSNITHWCFNAVNDGNNKQTPARKLSNNILLIADADITNKGDRVDSLKVDLGENFCLLEYKEIENYIPFEQLIDTAKKRWETFNGNKDARIDRFSNITEEKFKKCGVGIGEVLERYVDKPSNSSRNYFKDKSGTIKDKVKFCDTAIEVMNTNKNWKLTPELKKLCDKIWSFIEVNNA